MKNYITYLKENKKHDNDPYDEEIWDAPEDEIDKLIMDKTFYYIHDRNEKRPYVRAYKVVSRNNNMYYLEDRHVPGINDGVIMSIDVTIINNEQDLNNNPNKHVYLIPHGDIHMFKITFNLVLTRYIKVRQDKINAKITELEDLWNKYEDMNVDNIFKYGVEKWSDEREKEDI